MSRKAPSDFYADRIKLEVFGNEYKGMRSPTWLAEKLGISRNTVSNWRRNPTAMPAWQYLRIMEILKER